MYKKKKSKISVVVGVIAFVFFFMLEFLTEIIFEILPFLFALIPIIIFVIIAVVASKKYKTTQKNKEFDPELSYYEKKNTTSIEDEYLKGRNYTPSSDPHYFERKTTKFDKDHAHANMYPTTPVVKEKIEIQEELTKEEQLIQLYKDLRTLKNEYDDFKIGIIEFRERKQEIQNRIKQLEIEE